MMDLKQYLEGTNTVLLTKEFFEHLKERASALDKIRAEIEKQVLESLSDGGDDWFAAEKVNECLEIIEMYKAESEEEE